jgi:hypothetical protein
MAHVPHVARREIEVVLDRGGGEQGVDDGRRMARSGGGRTADGAPAADDGVGDWQEAVGEPCFKGVAGVP